MISTQRGALWVIGGALLLGAACGGGKGSSGTGASGTGASSASGTSTSGTGGAGTGTSGTGGGTMAPCDAVGFASTAESFTLPSGDYPATLGSIELGLFCQNGTARPNAFTMDIDGDRKLDLVVTQDCNDKTVGDTHWRVYKGNGAGFASTAESFTLPSGDYPATLGSIELGLFCQNGTARPNAFTVDIDGDGKPDLVVTQDCNDKTVGDTHWRVYKGNGAGFASTAESFALPSGDYPTTLGSMTLGLFCQNGTARPNAFTMDIDGDHKLDLVVTQDCNDKTVGDTHWRVYKGNGAGFASTAESFTLPSGDYPATLGSMTLGLFCQNGTARPNAFTVDIDGDGKPDLVVTQDCNDKTVGDTHWRVYKGNGAGFASTAESFALPSGDYPATLGSMTLGLFCQNGTARPNAFTMDIDGDRKPDLVVTQDCNDKTVGDTHWRVYKGQCAH